MISFSGTLLHSVYLGGPSNIQIFIFLKVLFGYGIDGTWEIMFLMQQ
jgi:hypothetical protein